MYTHSFNLYFHLKYTKWSKLQLIVYFHFSHQPQKQKHLIHKPNDKISVAIVNKKLMTGIIKMWMDKQDVRSETKRPCGWSNLWDIFRKLEKTCVICSMHVNCWRKLNIVLLSSVLPEWPKWWTPRSESSRTHLTTMSRHITHWSSVSGVSRLTGHHREDQLNKCLRRY